MMDVKEAVVARMDQLCEERGISLYQLATTAGMTPSTVYSLALDSRKDVGIVTIQKICAGLEISVADFFHCELFMQVQH